MTETPGFSNPRKPNGARARRYILAVIVFLALALIATHTFLRRTSVGGKNFVRMTFTIYTTTVLIVLALLILATVLGRNLIKLYFERKSGQLGSGFKTKMVRTFMALSLLPALLLFILAYSLISSSIEKWFGAPPAQMMENSRLLANQYYADAEERAKYYAVSIAGSVHSVEEFLPGAQTALRQKLEEYRRHYSLGSVRVYDNHGRPVLECGISRASNAHLSILKNLVAESILGRQGFQVERVAPRDPLDEISWASAPIRDPNGAVCGAVLTESIRPQSARYRADSVLEAYEKYQQLQLEKTALRFNALLILFLSTLLIVFAFSWFGMYLAKRITVPIQALAQGAAAVASGNLRYRVECQAFDELADLVASFNRMTGDLEENEKRIELAQEALRKTSVEHADRRRYIETILQTIATGVVSLDSSYRVRTMNRAAAQMLQAGEFAGDAPLEDAVPEAAGEALRALLDKSAVLGTVVRNIELAFPDKSLQIAATVTPLADAAGRRTGTVIVLEDMTELLRMEKMSAWQEVARRMAHEIKNPLTPIQLSAERVLKRYQQIMPAFGARVPEHSQEELAKFDTLLAECVQVIIREVDSLKRLVDEFSRFARFPEFRPEEANVNRILENTLSLYDGRIQDVLVQKDLDPALPNLSLDPEQMKRVFINVFDNALEAMAKNRDHKVLHLKTGRNAQQHCIRIEISDTGRGFPDEYRDNLFLPYFSTRKGGTGLGLAIVRQIIADHRGSISVEPNVPAGSRIVIDLPVSEV
ncbi:MAG TPA: ATP-binding protein [Acidobacteriota bacterium]|nr:ATP-binding protein [Acidobacteriota bacterium]